MTDETSELMDKGLIPRSVVPRNTTPNEPAQVIYDRITVVETISHQPVSVGEKAFPLQSKFWRTLSHHDRPYQRSFKVTEDSVPLDVGWAREWPGIGLIHVSNDEGRFFQTIPTPAEREALTHKVIELGEWLILPGESMRGVPADVNKLRIRSRSGTIRVTVTVYPA